MFRKTEDGAIDTLLRAHAGRAGDPPPLCREFDPDFANAYIEHSLAVGERARYEQHLSLCASCRKSVVVLARMAATDTVSTTSAAKSRGVIWESEPRWKALLGAMSRPQWAMAAAAIIILVISVPLFLSRKAGGVNQPPLEAQRAGAQPSSDAAVVGALGQQSPAANAAASNVAEPMAAPQASNAQERTTPRPAQPAGDSDESLKEPAAENASGSAGGAVAKSEPPQTQPVEAKPVDQKADQIASNNISSGQVPTPADAPAAQQSAPENQLAKIDPDKAKSVPEQSKEKTEVSVLQPGRPDGGQRAKTDAVVRPDEIAPPPQTSASRDRAMATPPAGLKSRLTPPARPRGSASERKIGGKKFWLKEGTWVDKDYDPNKDMPVVTFIRDSDVYKEHLAKRQGMKSYMTGFAENERVIFIYKGTVYIIVPQEGNK